MVHFDFCSWRKWQTVCMLKLLECLHPRLIYVRITIFKRWLPPVVLNIYIYIYLHTLTWIFMACYGPSRVSCVVLCTSPSPVVLRVLSFPLPRSFKGIGSSCPWFLNQSQVQNKERTATRLCGWSWEAILCGCRTVGQMVMLGCSRSGAAWSCGLANSLRKGRVLSVSLAKNLYNLF